MEDIALYTITNSNFSSESFEVKKYGSYDEFYPLVSANNLEDLSNKFDTISSLVNFNNSNLNNLQKELYDYIFKPIEDTLNENAAFTVFVLDSKLQNLPIGYVVKIILRF